MHEHVHTITCQRGDGRVIAARRAFRAPAESNRVHSVPAKATGYLIPLPVQAELVEALHVGCPLRDCPLVPVPAVSWCCADGEDCPEGFLCDNPSDEPVEVHVSCLHA